MKDREEECYYCIALTKVPHIGIRGAKRLYESIGSAKDIFKRARSGNRSTNG